MIRRKKKMSRIPGPVLCRPKPNFTIFAAYMKVSLNWLKTHIDSDAEPGLLAERLTASGLEVEGMEEFSAVQGGLKGLVVGEVIHCEQHPNADRLRLTKVDIGSGEPLSIVCGAPNVAAGQKVIVATVGTTLFPKGGESFEIKKSKIRGELSEGMICAEDEIGLGSDHSGIIILDPSVTTGTPAAKALGMESDTIIEIGLTANRGDAASHLGVARDVAAIFGQQIRKQETPFSAPASNPGWSISLPDPDCIRYTGLLIEGVVVKESPEWLRKRLQSIGLNPINNIVDVTNFVLHDIGQPIHAFDAAKVIGKRIEVKRAEPGSTFITLDGVSRAMKGSELMIWNAEAPMAIAGVFGGKDSGVSATTTSIFIESATFSASSIRRTAKLHGLSTDASFRYERGTDPEVTVDAMKKVAALILETAGGKVASPIIDEYPLPVAPAEIRLEKNYLLSLTGSEIPEGIVETILTSLAIVIKQKDERGWDLRIPAFKSDVTRPVDVVEEITRIFGLDNIPIPERVSVSYGEQGSTAYKFREKVRTHLAARGFTELVTNSLIKKEAFSEEARAAAVQLLNPLSQDLEIMRPGMLPSLLEVLAYNRNRKNTDVKVFEFGKTYRKTEQGFEEKDRLAMLICGRWNGESWHAKSLQADFFNLKQEVKEVLHICGLNMPLKFWGFETFNVGDSDGVAIRVSSVGQPLLKAFDIDTEVYYAELDWSELQKRMKGGAIQAVPPAKFPEVRRDLSLVLDKSVGFDKIMAVIKESDKGLIRNVNVFDVYAGDRIEAGKKSYAMSIILQDYEKTLSDKEIDALMNRLMSSLETKTGALIRK